ncbi:hypothetical protein Nepgr_004225 [Nepenthes gracilis]|uniref:DUF4378 domain-containing protein n=1 Tax=Nepenthes gracilis TaxID=150966 RepID=A0AAD3XF23_NEPGR|nr:hypothetical protein Nepgr_004225 [Nepenthes gracilis]
MTTGTTKDQPLKKQAEKNMGCMAGCLNLFDRNHILSGKLFYAKRLPPSPGVDLASDVASPVRSPAVSEDIGKPTKTKSPSSPLLSKPMPPPSPEVSSPRPSENPAKSLLAVSSFEFRESVKSPWKFSREAPRLSLDSRAVLDAKGSLHPREIRTKPSQCDSGSGDESEKQKRSPTVIARLMGLELLPHSVADLPEENVELRRSASESRSKELLANRFINSSSVQLQQIVTNRENAVREFNNHNKNSDNMSAHSSTALNVITLRSDHADYPARTAKSEVLRQRTAMQERKSFYESVDIFPEPKRTASMRGEIKRRLKMRGIDETSEDLETLKQILESLQLKGLLHSKPSEQIGQQNFVQNRRLSCEEPPVVVMKPTKSPASRRINSDSPSQRFRSKAVSHGNLNHNGEASLSVRPLRQRQEMKRDSRSRMENVNLTNSPNRGENRSLSPVVRKKALNVETRKREHETTAENRRVSPVQSPKLRTKRSDQTMSRSPRSRRPAAEIYPNEKMSLPPDDRSATLSESSYSTYSHTDTERWKTEEHKEGDSSLLERCDKLLHGIAKMNATTELQPSPVSVLDSSFCKDDDSPSPIMKRTIDFKGQLVQFEDEVWSQSSSDVHGVESDSSDFAYVSEIFRAARHLPEDSDVFPLLEERQYLKGKDTSKVSRLRRKLIFDTISEILDNQQSPPWKLVSPENLVSKKPSLRRTWSELQKIREPAPSEDLFDTVYGVLKKDFAGDSTKNWVNYPLEVSETVMNIEQLIFKELIGESITGLATLARKPAASASSRWKLIF